MGRGVAWHSVGECEFPRAHGWSHYTMIPIALHCTALMLVAAAAMVLLLLLTASSGCAWHGHAVRHNGMGGDDNATATATALAALGSA